MTGIFDPHCDCPKCRSRAAAALSALPAAQVKALNAFIDAVQEDDFRHFVDGKPGALIAARDAVAALSAPAMPDPTPRVIEGEPVAVELTAFLGVLKQCFGDSTADLLMRVHTVEAENAALKARLDEPLPVSVTVGVTTFTAGVKTSTLIGCLDRHRAALKQDDSNG